VRAVTSRVFFCYNLLGKMNQHRNRNNTPLLYTSLSTRRCSYPNYIMLLNATTPIPIKRQILGNDVCLSLVTSGRAVPLPPLVDDIADTLSWLQEINSPMHLRCIYNAVSFNLLRVCILDEAHIHPLDAHYELALIATDILIQTHFPAEFDGNIIAWVSSHLDFCWGHHRLHLVPFSTIIRDIYAYLNEVCKYNLFFNPIFYFLSVYLLI
jgi:hypothetical protein